MVRNDDVLIIVIDTLINHYSYVDVLSCDIIVTMNYTDMIIIDN